jgi:hypothetical protein
MPPSFNVLASIPPDFMTAPTRYFHWGFIYINVANLIVILLMIAVFILALLVPFPRRGI